MVNAPASPSEVTLPQKAREAREGAPPTPRLSGLWEARPAGPKPRPGSCRARVAEISRAGELRARGDERAAAGRRSGLVLSNLISFALASPELPRTLAGVRGGIVPAAGGAWECTWRTAAPLSFVVRRSRGSGHRLPQTPRAR